MAEYIKVPAGVYDMVTRCMEQEFPDHVAIRYVAEDGKTVVEKKYREYAQDIRRMTAYLKAEVPDIKGRRIVLLSRNCYEFCVGPRGACPHPERRHRLRLPRRAGSRLRPEAPPHGLL